jgi:hypothetical protein
LIASAADAIIVTTIAVFVFIAVIAIWRVLVHDRSVRRIRLGIFYERERADEEDPWERAPELPPEVKKEES